jgi:hypothetical protein
MKTLKQIILAVLLGFGSIHAATNSTEADVKRTIEGVSLVVVGAISAGVALNVRDTRDYRGHDKYLYHVSACVSITSIISGISILFN